MARRILYVNVTATLGVEITPGATTDEVEAALDLTSLSADDPIGLLSNDPDRFFGRTTKVCHMLLVETVMLCCAVPCSEVSVSYLRVHLTACDNNGGAQSQSASC